MASKKAKSQNVFQAADQLKSGVSNINQEAIQLADKLVDRSVKNAARWQKLMAKGMLTGVSLFGKQQELVFNVLEELKGQYKYGHKRTMKLLNDTEKPMVATKAKTVKAKTVTKKTKKVLLAGAENKMDDLKKIEGVGPKIASLLNEAGITTFYQLSIAKVKDLEGILAAAGTRYKSHDPKPWIAQSKELIKAKAEVATA